jgi:hypothetical protein
MRCGYLRTVLAGCTPADPLYRRILTYLGGAVPTAAETVEDPEMVFGSAELSLYEPSHDLEELPR